jgi:N-acyl-D-aspartate/D-glutamate deacylase
MQEALRKMSLMPAQTLEGFVPQMKKKGRLQVGMDADIVVFDPKTISDVGTYEKPNQPAVGVQSVLVNGELVVANNKLIVDARPGRPVVEPVVCRNQPCRAAEAACVGGGLAFRTVSNCRANPLPGFGHYCP